MHLLLLLLEESLEIVHARRLSDFIRYWQRRYIIQYTAVNQHLDVLHTQLGVPFHQYMVRVQDQA